MKKLICVFFVMLISVCTMFAQQIQMFGVVDTDLVYTTYFRDSAAARDYDAKKAEFQIEIGNREKELDELVLQKLEHEKTGNITAARRLEEQIAEEIEFLTEYTWSKNNDLDALKANLVNSDTFYKDLYQSIRDVAEEEGYSIILSLQQAAVIWYHPDVDITNKIIARLGL